MKWTRLFAVAAFAFPIDSSSASQTAPKSFDDVLEGVRKKHNVPSLAAVLIREGAVVASATVGERALGSGVPVQLTDTYQLGSVSKSFTATMIAKLVEQNVLRWNATLEQLLPDQRMSASYRKVRLEQLLFHAGGFPANIEGDAPYDWDLEPSKARALYLESALSSTPLSAPGEKFSYSNMGYIVAAIIAERTTGKSWEQLVKELVLEPLRLQSCDFGTRFEALTQPHGHEFDDSNRLVAVSPEEPNGNSPVMFGADGLRCSLADMSRYLLAHLSGIRGENSAILSSSFAVLHTARLETGNGTSAAMGWFVFPNGIEVHDGSNTINYARVILGAQKNVALFIGMNAPTELGAEVAEEATQAIFEWKP
jgi:CubicO group peptidase (beta-lactamase class C family)